MPTPQQITDVTNWLKKTAPGFKCAACQGQSFTMGEIIASSTVGAGGSLVIGGPTIPMVPMVCNTCGHVELFAAVIMGITI